MDITSKNSEEATFKLTDDEIIVLEYLFESDSNLTDNFELSNFGDSIFKLERKSTYNIDKIIGYILHIFDTMNDSFLMFVKNKTFKLKRKEE